MWKSKIKLFLIANTLNSYIKKVLDYTSFWIYLTHFKYYPPKIIETKQHVDYQLIDKTLLDQKIK